MSDILSQKQHDYIRFANCRWNIKSGAMRSGKTFVDYFNIPIRIRNAGEGIIVLIGATRMSLERNILEPMRDIWGNELVGKIGQKGSITLFGRTCWTVSGTISGEASKLQGCSVSYCYGDEITVWKEEVFRMIQSRLDRHESCFDGTCNPASPSHWFKSFLDSDADIFLQNYILDDNIFLDEGFKTNLKKEYAGTFFYDRYILGKWIAAEGCIYKKYANAPKDFLIKREDIFPLRIIIGLDFGGNRSKNALVALGLCRKKEADEFICALLSDCFEPEDPISLYRHTADFIIRLKKSYGILPEAVYCDNADPVLIRGLKSYFTDNNIGVSVKSALKTPVISRIRKTVELFSAGKLFLCEEAASLSRAFCDAVWDGDSDRRRDDFTSDIDTLDAFEYALERIRTDF